MLCPHASGHLVGNVAAAGDGCLDPLQRVLGNQFGVRQCAGDRDPVDVSLAGDVGHARPPSLASTHRLVSPVRGFVAFSRGFRPDPGCRYPGRSMKRIRVNVNWSTTPKASPMTAPNTASRPRKLLDSSMVVSDMKAEVASAKGSQPRATAVTNSSVATVKITPLRSASGSTCTAGGATRRSRITWTTICTSTIAATIAAVAAGRTSGPTTSKTGPSVRPVPMRTSPQKTRIPISTCIPARMASTRPAPREAAGGARSFNAPDPEHHVPHAGREDRANDREWRGKKWPDAAASVHCRLPQRGFGDGRQHQPDNERCQRIVLSFHRKANYRECQHHAHVEPAVGQCEGPDDAQHQDPGQ